MATKSKNANALLTTADIPNIVQAVISSFRQKNLIVRPETQAERDSRQRPLEPGYVDVKPMTRSQIIKRGPLEKCPNCGCRNFDRIESVEHKYYSCTHCGFTWLPGRISRYTPPDKPTPDGDLTALFDDFEKLKNDADEVLKQIIARIKQFNFNRDTIVHCMEEGMLISRAEAQARFSRMKNLFGDGKIQIKTKRKR